MKSSMEQIREMVDVDTIVGKPILVGTETVILPVSKVSLGFVSGGGEYPPQKSVKSIGTALDGDTRFPFAGAAVGGMSITPMAFLSVAHGSVCVLPAQYDSTLDRLVGVIPDTLDKLMDKLYKDKDGEGACDCGED